MTFTESIKTCFGKYIDFSGRASRSEYWWFFLFTFIVRITIGWIPGVGFIVSLAVLLPSLAVTVRRLHDTNRTGWWLLLPIGLTVVATIVGVVLSFAGLLFLGVGLAVGGSLAGFVTLIVFLVQAGDPHTNQYGPDPLQQVAGTSAHESQGHHYSAPPSTGDYDAPTFNNEPPAPSPTAEVGQRQYCTQCGIQLQPDARFCTVCGTAV